MILAVLSLACIPEPPKQPDPPPTPKPTKVFAPDVNVAPPTRDAASPYIQPSTPELDHARAKLLEVVTTYAPDPESPWAIGHGLLVLGPDMKLTDGRSAVPYLFERYAEWVDVGDEKLVSFPAKEGPILIEPHSDLVLKALTEIGVPLDKTFRVEGKPATVEQVYLNSLFEAYYHDADHLGFTSPNDTPWALQALSSQAPSGLLWTAADGQQMRMDGFTDAVVDDLWAQTAFMREAMGKGQRVAKRRQGIYAYTCGGAHMFQGAGYAVARGFGAPDTRQHVVDLVDVLYWSVDNELWNLDETEKQAPQFATQLLEQRVKFLGHFLETTHKLAALGLYTPDDAQKAKLDFARDELVRTVGRLENETQLFQDLPALRAIPDPTKHQLYLDTLGDSAHAIRGIDLSTGAGTIRY
ncbi:MAG: hypothetical protein H6737_27190 [Alphaproteobacteria bacterium]|nr:hypothetical protein [Alphaproteobacteria bacterium]